MTIASDSGGTTSGPGLQALCDGFGFAQAELARQIGVLRRRATTIESQGALPMVPAERYLQAREALAA